MKSPKLAPLVGVRVDGGKHLGMGHILKQAILMSALKKSCAGLHVRFFVKQDASAIAWLKLRGFKVSAIPPSITKHREPSWIAGALPVNRNALLILDILDVSKQYIQELRRSGKVNGIVTFENRSQSKYLVEAAINAIVTGPKNRVKKTAAGYLYAGGRYRVTHQDYQEVILSGKRRSEIVVTFGGGDDKGLTAKAGQTLAKALPGFRISLIQGPAQRLKPVARNTNIRIVKSPRSLAPYFSSAAAALTAGGGTLYELALCGVPAIAFAKVPHQRRNIRFFESAGTLINGGDLTAAAVARSAEKLRRLLADSKKIKRMSLQGRKLVDQNGTLRVAGILKQILKSKIKRNH